MAESDQNEKTNPTISGEEVEEGEIESFDEAEKENDEIIEEKEEEGDDDDGEEEEEEEEEAYKEEQMQKKRRCQRKKKKPCCSDEAEEEEEEEVKEKKAQDEEEEEGEEEGEEEESDIISTGFSVLSAITFIWENDVYEFEELCDPGNIETIYQEHFIEPQKLDDYGINRYLELCTTMKIAPMISLLRFLKTEEIDLSYHNINSNNIKAMCAALEINRTVKRLILKYNKLKVKDCLYIGRIMHYNQKISHLDFTGCRIGPQGLELIIAYLLQTDAVVYLNLSKCDIQDEGIKSLAYILMTSVSIQNIDLSYNKLGEESAGALGWVFKTNNCIKNLNLRYNNLFDPTSMRGFFRYLSTSFSITHLDLSWNAMNGVDMGTIIGNFLRRSESIEYLDISDNRFQGMAVIEIQLGLSRSRTLETLKMGKNPMSPEDMENLLWGAKWCRNLKLLDLEDLWVNTSFIKNLKKIQQEKDIEVVFEGVLSNYVIHGPDYPTLIFQRAQFEAQKPKNEKKKKDFGHLIWTLGSEPLPPEEFLLRVKKFKAKITKELFPELMKQFKVPKSRLINVVAMKEKYLSVFPESMPPPSISKGKAKREKVGITPDLQENLQEALQLEEEGEEEGSNLMLFESEDFEEVDEDLENIDESEIAEIEEKKEANE